MMYKGEYLRSIPELSASETMRWGTSMHALSLNKAMHGIGLNKMHKGVDLKGMYGLSGFDLTT